MNTVDCFDFEGLALGESARFARTINEPDTILLAGASGGNHAVHIDEEFARTTPLKGGVALGMPTTGVFSAASFGELPAPGTSSLWQNLRFWAPARPGKTMHRKVTVNELLHEKCCLMLGTGCPVNGKVVIDDDTPIVPTSWHNWSGESFVGGPCDA